MGDKWPYADFIVELLDTGGAKPFFFIQVKTTRAGYKDISNDLKAPIKREHLEGIVSYPAPTYLIGIDEKEERGFIVSVNGESLKGRSAMTTKYPLDTNCLSVLWSEVNAFWKLGATPKLQSRFTDERWR